MVAQRSTTKHNAAGAGEGCHRLTHRAVCPWSCSRCVVDPACQPPFLSERLLPRGLPAGLANVANVAWLLMPQKILGLTPIWTPIPDLTCSFISGVVVVNLVNIITLEVLTGMRQLRHLRHLLGPPNGALRKPTQGRLPKGADPVRTVKRCRLDDGDQASRLGWTSHVLVSLL